MLENHPKNGGGEIAAKTAHANISAGGHGAP
jgi:hypothetical protein